MNIKTLKSLPKNFLIDFATKGLSAYQAQRNVQHKLVMASLLGSNCQVFSTPPAPNAVLMRDETINKELQSQTMQIMMSMGTKLPVVQNQGNGDQTIMSIESPLTDDYYLAHTVATLLGSVHPRVVSLLNEYTDTALANYEQFKESNPHLKAVIDSVEQKVGNFIEPIYNENSNHFHNNVDDIVVSGHSLTDNDFQIFHPVLQALLLDNKLLPSIHIMPDEVEMVRRVSDLCAQSNDLMPPVMKSYLDKINDITECPYFTTFLDSIDVDVQELEYPLDVGDYFRKYMKKQPFDVLVAHYGVEKAKMFRETYFFLAYRNCLDNIPSSVMSLHQSLQMFALCDWAINND